MGSQRKWTVTQSKALGADETLNGVQWQAGRLATVPRELL